MKGKGRERKGGRGREGGRERERKGGRGREMGEREGGREGGGGRKGTLYKVSQIRGRTGKQTRGNTRAECCKTRREDEEDKKINNTKQGAI